MGDILPCAAAYQAVSRVARSRPETALGDTCGYLQPLSDIRASVMGQSRTKADHGSRQGVGTDGTASQ